MLLDNELQLPNVSMAVLRPILDRPPLIRVYDAPDAAGARILWYSFEQVSNTLSELNDSMRLVKVITAAMLGLLLVAFVYRVLVDIARAFLRRASTQQRRVEQKRQDVEEQLPLTQHQQRVPMPNGHVPNGQALRHNNNNSNNNINKNSNTKLNNNKIVKDNSDERIDIELGGQSQAEAMDDGELFLIAEEQVPTQSAHATVRGGGGHFDDLEQADEIDGVETQAAVEEVQELVSPLVADDRLPVITQCVVLKYNKSNESNLSDRQRT